MEEAKVDRKTKITWYGEICFPAASFSSTVIVERVSAAQAARWKYQMQGYNLSRIHSYHKRASKQASLAASKRGDICMNMYIGNICKSRKLPVPNGTIN